LKYSNLSSHQPPPSLSYFNFFTYIRKASKNQNTRKREIKSKEHRLKATAQVSREIFIGVFVYLFSVFLCYFQSSLPMYLIISFFSFLCYLSVSNNLRRQYVNPQKRAKKPMSMSIFSSQINFYSSLFPLCP
jgi:hypothetical protein